MATPDLSTSVVQVVGSWLTPSWVTWLVLLLGLWVCYRVYQIYTHWVRQRQRQTIDRQCQGLDTGETIFVSLASYRDPQCAETIYDLLEKAYCPFRITIGVCQQNADGDEDVLEAYRRLAQRGINDFSDRLRIHRIGAHEARGPMYARHLIEKHLYRQEAFYLVTDSHMLFTPHWDRKLLEEWKTCARWSERPILTMYPDDFQPHHRILPPPNYDTARGSYLRFKKFNEQTGLVEIEGPAFVRKPSTPVPGLFWAAGFSFGPASMIRDVPFDPHCDYVFFGEEISMAARLWTSGYDFYHPTTMYVYHMWERRRPTFWQQLEKTSDPVHLQRRQQEREGYRRLRKVLRLSDDAVTVLPPYGLGRVRSLEDYERLVGIRMKTQQFTSLSGALGLSEQAPAHEVLCKFGTWKNFESAQHLVGRLLTPAATS